MDAHERPVEIKEMFDAFHDALAHEQFEAAREQLQKIEDLIGRDDAELISAHVALDLAEM